MNNIEVNQWYIIHKNTKTIFHGPYYSGKWARSQLESDRARFSYLDDLVLAKCTMAMEIIE